MKISPTPLPTVLVGLNAALILCVLGLLFFYHSASIPKLEQAEFRLEEVGRSDGNNKAGTGVDYNIILEKALFHETRKPVVINTPKPDEPRKQVARSNLTDYLLTGIVYKSAGESIAYITGKKTGEKFKLTIGDSFGEWKVVNIGKAEVIVSRGGRQEPLMLVQKKK